MNPEENPINVKQLTKQYEDKTSGMNVDGQDCGSSVDRPRKDVANEKEKPPSSADSHTDQTDNEKFHDALQNISSANPEQSPQSRDINSDTPGASPSAMQSVIAEEQPRPSENRNPVVQNPIRIQEDDKVVLINWPGHEDVKSYKIHIEQDERAFDKTSKISEYKLVKKDYKFSNGMIFTMQITLEKTNGDVIAVYETTYTVGGEDVPTSVVAAPSATRSYDTIDIRWNPPKREAIDYEVILLKTKDKSVMKTVRAGKAAISITGVDPNTEYFCMVNARFGPKDKGKIVHSNNVSTTGMPSRYLNPRKVNCHADPHNPARKIVVQWEKPQAGEPKYYECSLYLHRDSHRNPTDFQNVQSTSAVFSSLSSETMHFGAVRAVFVNGETSEKIFSDGATTQSEIQKPGDLTVTWSETDIITAWSPAKGATSYRIRVTDEANKEVVNGDVTDGRTHFKFDMTQTCRYGSRCNFTVEACGAVEKRTEVSKMVLIGGEYAVTDVTVVKGEINPRRHLKVAWSPPKQKPAEYKVVLYEVEISQHTSREKISRETTLTEPFAKFENLKSGTKYFCELTPVYPRRTQLAGGSRSKYVVTDTRIIPALEQNEAFGKPEGIIPKTEIKSAKETTGRLFWSRVNVGENYQLLGYIITVTQKSWGGIWISNIFTGKCKPDETSINLENLQMGNTYQAGVTTKMKDLDTLAESAASGTQEFHTNPSTTEIYNCTWKDGIVTFHWMGVNGAKTYKLIINDPLKDECIHECEMDALKAKNAEKQELTQKNVDKCDKRIEMSPKLCIGRTCRVKIIVTTEKNLKSRTDWKTLLIGHPNVPRNVNATLCMEDPNRSINITCDQPLEGSPDSYKVVALPECGGRQKVMHCKGNNIRFEYLRSGVEYKFEVHAVYGSVTSEGSTSNKCKTGGSSKTGPMIGISEVAGRLDMRKAHFHGSTTNVNMPHPEFGKVRDLGVDLTPQNQMDAMTVHWTVPAFDNKPADYKVEKFDVTIKKENESKGHETAELFRKDAYEYKTTKHPLELGETYLVSVKTCYDDIDQDAELKSSAEKLIVHTRPCQPKMLPNAFGENGIKIEWNHAKGATSYNIKIFVEDSSQPIYNTNTMEKTRWSRDFNEEFGYGTSFCAQVTAIGMENKTNSVRTSRETIGGNLVPRSVHGTITHENVTDPNSQVHLEWEAPKTIPESYEVTAEPPSNNLSAAFNGTTCLVSGLKAGMEYIFKVKAVHEGPKSERKVTSGGSASNKVKTNPTPTQVKDVKFLRSDKDSSTSVIIEWGMVDAEKMGESIKYRVVVTSKDKSRKQEINVVMERVVVIGLDPGEIYIVTVAGENSEGFGRDSDPIEVYTEFGMPRNIHLTHVDGSASTELKVYFEPAEGTPTGYSAILMKNTNTGFQKAMENGLEVSSGEEFSNLEPNTEYLVKIHAIYKKGEGKAVESCKLVTAPGKARIKFSKCCEENGCKCPARFCVKWEPVTGCDVHEVLVKHKDSGTEEACIVLKNTTEYVHVCHHASIPYSAWVRSRNSSGFFGDWSSEAMINLAPKAMEKVYAKISEKDNTILVECDKLEYDPRQYHLQSSYNGTFMDAIMTDAEVVEKKVTFIYKPPVEATEYSFWVWAKGFNDLEGKKTLSNAVISKPAKGITPKVETSDKNSTDLQVSWQLQERCDGYEIAIHRSKENEPESILRFGIADNCLYHCHSPGDSYSVKVRCICKSCCGEWSEAKQVELAPDDVELIEDLKESRYIRDSVTIKWKPPKVKPNDYIAKLFSGDTLLGAYKGSKTSCTFKENLKPGFECYCTVAATRSGTTGKETRSKVYKILWSKPQKLEVTSDKNEPSKRARIAWDKPFGVNCFKLEIENNENGVKTIYETVEQQHVFESGMPGNQYTIRLHCGCDSRYDPDFKEAKMIMKPVPPSNIRVWANDTINGLQVEFQDNTMHDKEYAVAARPLKNLQIVARCVTTKMSSCVLRDLDAGESYKVSVTANLKGISSKEAFHEDEVQTFPGEIKNLRSSLKDGSILYEWDVLDVRPKEYRVQWRCNDDPVTEETTHKTTFVKRHPNSGCFYSVRVFAVNKSGHGPMCEWETFLTDPAPPYNIQGWAHPNSPETSLVVKFQDSHDDMKRYRITATGKTEGKKEVETSQLHAVLNELVPGEEYAIQVVTLFCGKESKPGVYVEVP